MNATEIIERRRAEDEAVRRYYRDQRAEADRAAREHAESLPRLSYQPPTVERGVLYRLATETVWAFDGVRVFKAATPGSWVPEDRAEVLGIGGPAVLLKP